MHGIADWQYFDFLYSIEYRGYGLQNLKNILTQGWEFEKNTILCVQIHYNGPFAAGVTWPQFS